MMSRELERIRNDQREIVNAHISNCPVKLGKLACDLGVSIKVSSLRVGISGQIMNEDGKYIIRVNRYEARERQRFTIAHELAHFLLHQPIIDSSEDGITDTVLYRSGAPERVEYEANRLAADIVMPLYLIERQLDDEYGGVVTDVTIEGLAASFQVSKAAMEIRLATFVEA